LQHKLSLHTTDAYLLKRKYVIPRKTVASKSFSLNQRQKLGVNGEKITFHFNLIAGVPFSNRMAWNVWAHMPRVMHPRFRLRNTTTDFSISLHLAQLQMQS